jgi:hypothetical protein
MRKNWCHIFARDDYELLAYYNDLKSYWLKSYGYELNSKVALLIYKDLFESMDAFIQQAQESQSK